VPAKNANRLRPGSGARDETLVTVFETLLGTFGARGTVVLRHYATSRKVGEYFFFSIHLILPTTLVPGVYSTSNRNQYQKKKINVSGE
jgi:hypothetical protein